ncbi:MAG: NADH:flavin oxidoreductase [Desulfobacterales bacterium]|jgi:2,4-dienoyl-CoA reductase-like NADH-dependent reductase (Old Yellow Enzyme family)|nr:NADH:flavin oxidoreductase [Desulfobacterales bacterium]
MAAISLERMFRLLGTAAVPGTGRELKALSTRIGELVELNGEAWVRRHRGRLLAQWRRALGAEPALPLPMTQPPRKDPMPLFEAAAIKAMRLRNRFVRSATWEAMAAADGAVTARLVETTAALARGGVGLIISSHAFIRPEGQAGPGQVGAYADALVPGLRQMAAAAHENGAKILLQLAHAGYFAAEALTGVPPIAVSAAVRLDDTPRREMGAADIGALVAAFAAAAVRAKAAGFDGVQLHCAHGYLLNQFLSPLFNRRKDDYGGALANRARVHVETIRAIRRAVGPEYPVLAKVNSRDFAEGGLEPPEALEAALLMEQAGLDAVELSSGMTRHARFGAARTGIRNQAQEAYHREEAKLFKAKLRIPLILVGGIRSLPVAERLVREGVCDFIAMSRPLIREPDLINRWTSGDRRKAACTSDNLCFGPARRGEGLYCVTAARKKRRSP